jgi:hypothetical protein
MAKLSDLVNVNINRDSVTVQGVSLPVVFSMISFPYVEEAYGKPYHQFEKDMHRMMKKGQVVMGKNEMRLMRALIFAMVKTGGTDCTPHELEGAIPPNDLPGIFQTALNIFNNQTFQVEDAEKIKSEKKN